MPGMEVPQPGGAMKKMSLEFVDPATAAPQIPAGAGVPPAGAEGAIPPAGAQAPPQGPPMGGQDPMQGGMAPPQPTMFDQYGQGGQDTGMFSDEDLMQLVGDEDPAMMAGEDMAMQAESDPMIQQQLMEAARRRLGGF